MNLSFGKICTSQNPRGYTDLNQSLVDYLLDFQFRPTVLNNYR